MSGDVFIIDDNPNNLNLLAGILRDRKYGVRMANAGKRALAAVRAAPPELIMLDITMPEMDGYEVCEKLKSDPTTRDIPVIFISALDDVLDKVKAFRVGGVDYVTKPFQAEEVLARVESQLGLSRLRKELERKNDELEKTNDELRRSQEKTKLVFSALSEVLPGTVLAGKYRLEKKIGSGGFGVVYRATHTELGRPIAAKILHPTAGGDPRLDLERFRLEGLSSCLINHPNAVTVLDFGVTSTGIAYLIMELLDGYTLASEIEEKGKLSLQRCAEIMIPVCDVLAEAHAAGIVHRDIKPDNIFLHQTKSEEIVKVVDFGIAKLLGEAPNLTLANLTITGKLIGTPIYMSPERLSNKAYDGRADVYSVGVMLYQMLSGVRPFEAVQGNFYALLQMCVNEEPPSLADAVPEVPPAVEAVVMRALTKDPLQRPTAREMSDDLAAALNYRKSRLTS